METIRNYVDTMFKDFPKTKEVVDMKLNILDTMEDKYNQLIEEGKNENEAIGTVISQFGNIDELKAEMGITSLQNIEEDTLGQTYVSYTDESQIADYLRYRKTFGTAIGLGVMLCILACLGPIADQSRHSIIGITIFFFMIAIAVAIFIIQGMKATQFRDFQTKEIHLTPDLKAFYQERSRSFQNTFAFGIAFAVILCILSPAAYMISEHLFYQLFQTYSFTEFLVNAPFFTLIAIAVFLFVKLGIMKSSYQYILNNSTVRKNSVQAQKQEEKENRIYAIIMPLVAMLYLLIGFLFGWWHPGWIIFPITAILINAYIYLTKKEA